MKPRSLVGLLALCVVASFGVLIAGPYPAYPGLQEAAPPAKPTVQEPATPAPPAAAAEPALTELQRLKRDEYYRRANELGDPRKMGEAIAAFVVQWGQAAQKAFKDREDYDRSLAVPGYDGPTGPEGTYKKKPAGK